MSSDAELVEAALRGDAASLGLLLERYRAPLYGLALRILGHGSEAQDAVHDTILIALRRIEELREPSAVGGWLHAVLRNVCRSPIPSPGWGTRPASSVSRSLFEEPAPTRGDGLGCADERCLPVYSRA